MQNQFDIPVSKPDARAYLKQRLDMRLNDRQANGLAKLVAGLDSKKERLRDGTRITSEENAIRWLLEQCDAVPVPESEEPEQAG